MKEIISKNKHTKERMRERKIEVVILAAGVGSRLRPLTDKLPKCLIEINESNILERVLNQLKKHERVESISVLTGHEHEKLNNFLNQSYPDVRHVYNPDYKITNNMYSLSLFLNRRKEENDLIIINADCVYETEIVNKCIKFEGSCIMADSSLYQEESMKIGIEEGKVIKISKKIAKDKNVFTSIDLYKFEPQEANVLHEIVNQYISSADLNQWTEVAINELVDKNDQVYSNDISGLKWFEIDTMEDLENARKLFSNAN